MQAKEVLYHGVCIYIARCLLFKVGTGDLKLPRCLFVEKSLPETRGGDETPLLATAIYNDFPLESTALFRVQEESAPSPFDWPFQLLLSPPPLPLQTPSEANGKATLCSSGERGTSEAARRAAGSL